MGVWQGEAARTMMSVEKPLARWRRALHKPGERQEPETKSKRQQIDKPA